MSKPRVAFLGLGIMGSGMARRLLANGFPVAVFNRDPQKAGAFADAGARVATSARDAAAGAEVIISMVADDTASRAMWLGENGALSAAAPGTVCIDSSTVTVDWVRELSAAVEAQKCEFLDAPVTGSKNQAGSGELNFLVGGSAGTLEKVQPVLAAMSKSITLVGPVGSGALIKLINNFVCGVQAAALAEAFALITREKLDPAKALPLLLNGAPGSPLCKTLATRHTTSDPTIYFQLQLMAKDLRYAVAEAKAHGLNLATAQAAQSTFDAATAAGLGEGDMSGIIKYLA